MLLASVFLFAAIGSIDPHVTQENIHSTICVPGYSTQVRPSRQWSAAFKTRLLKQREIPKTQRGQFEMDHIVPIEVGGCPMCPENITLQPWGGAEGAKSKDRVENRVHREVCSGKLTLRDGQDCFLGDWRSCR